jgi:hypothetical protein
MLCSVVLPIGCSTTQAPFASASAIEKSFVSAAITWDLSRDGTVTCEEWKQYAAALFKEADANHNGALSRDEFTALSRRDRLFETAGFTYLDAQKDGQIALTEIVDRRNPAFVLMDANSDCTITPEERAHPRAAKGTLGL